VDGAADKIGTLPWVAFGAWEGNDGYPIGQDPVGPDFRVTMLGLYDTGAAAVIVHPLAVSYLSNNAGLQSPVDLRINGFQRLNPATWQGPWGVSDLNEGGPSRASLEVQGVNLELNIDADGDGNSDISSTPLSIPGSPNVVPVFPSLLGAPITNRSIALIDYTMPSEVSAGFAGAVVKGVAIDFFAVGSAPPAALTLQLGRFGSSGTSSNGSDRGQRYVLGGVTFTYGSQTPRVATGSFFYDTGSTVTFINNAMARSLAIPSGVTSSFPCQYGGVAQIGVQVSSFSVAGTGGSYTVQNAQVCWVQSELQFAGTNALIGSNLFAQVPVLFDGINNTLGILAQPPRPPRPPSDIRVVP
jgi:hypothetical protein